MITDHRYGLVTGNEYAGLSTDVKPTGELVLENSLFLELDTGDFYYYTSGTWVAVGQAPADNNPD